MQLRHFRYFIAVAEEGGFLKAARRLHVAQPSLSKQIQNLEREVGVQLFERLPRGVRLTLAGQAFLNDARKTVENAAMAMETARSADERFASGLRFAHGSLAHYAAIVSDLIAQFRQLHPEVEVRIHRLDESQQRKAILEQRVDAAITFVGEYPVPGFSALPIMDTSVTGVLLPAAHPVAARSMISLRDLRGLTFVHVPRRTAPEIYRIVKHALFRRGLVPEQRRERPRDMHLASVEIAAQDGFMLTNEETAHVFMNDNQAIVYRPFIEPPINFWLVLLWNLHSISPWVQSLAGLIGSNEPVPQLPKSMAELRA